MEQQINTFTGGMDTDTALEVMDTNSYLDALDIMVVPNTENNLTKVMERLPMGAIPLPNLLAKPRLRAFRIELDFSAANIDHEFTFLGGGVTPLNFTISTALGTDMLRYNALVSALQAALAPINSSINPTATSFYPDNVVVITFTDTTDEITGTQQIAGQSEQVIDIVQEVVQNTGETLRIAAMETFGDNLFVFYNYVDTGIIAVAKKNEATGVWTNTRLIESKQFVFNPDNVFNLKIDRNGDYLSLYWVDGATKPKTFTIPYQETWVEDSGLKYTVTDPVTPVGLYTYNNLYSLTNLQIFTNTSYISDITVNNVGGGFVSGNKQFALRFKVGGSYTNFSVLSDIIPIFTRGTGDFIGGGGLPNIPTSKSVTLDLENMPLGLFEYFQVAVIQNTGGAISTIGLGDFPVTSTAFSLTLSGGENPVNLDNALFAELSPVIKTAHLNEIIENKYFLGRIEVETDPDVQDWVENVLFAPSNITIVASELDSVGTYTSPNPLGEYMNADNCEKYVGYTYNELYRYGIRFYLRNGYITKTYYGADVLIANDSTGKLGNLTNALGTKVYVYSPKLTTIDFTSAPDIDGVPFTEAVEAFEIMRVECVADVVDTGYLLLGDQQNTVGSDLYRFMGATFSGGGAGTGGGVTDFKQAAFISQSILVNNTSNISSANKLRVYCTPTVATFDLSGVARLQQWTGYFTAAPSPIEYDIDTAILNPFNSQTLIAVDGGGVKNWIDGRVNSSTTINNWGNNSVMVAMLSPSDLLPMGGGATDGYAYYCQVIRGLDNNRYGDKYSSQYISTGEFDLMRVAPYNDYIIFGGDTFTQKGYYRMAYNGYVAIAVSPTPLRTGVAYYSQNRFNAQMTYSNSNEDLVYPLTTRGDDLIEWLSTYFDVQEPRLYDIGFTPNNNVRVSASFNPNIPVATNMGSTVFYSDEKLENDMFDAFRVFRFNNQKTYETSDGLLTGMYKIRESLALIQQYALRVQPISPNVTVTNEDTGAVIIGTGSVLGTKEIFISRYGALLKTQSTFYRAANGTEYVAYFDNFSKKLLRYGADGIKCLSDINKCRTFFLNNTQFIQNEFDMILYYDPYVEQLQVSCNVVGDDVTAYNNLTEYSIGDKVYESELQNGSIYISIINDNVGNSNLTTDWFAWEEYLNSNFNIGFNEKFNCFSTRLSHKPLLATTYVNTAVLVATDQTFGGDFLIEANGNGSSAFFTSTPKIKFSIAKQPNLFKRFLKSWVNIEGGSPSLVVVQSDDGTASQITTFEERRGRWLFNIIDDYYNTGKRVGGNKFKVTMFFTEKLHNFVSTLIYKDRKFNS